MKERDSETGYDYFGARYYDSWLGRWLQVDPLAEKYAGWSPFNYCLNNPLKYADPNGKWALEQIHGKYFLTVMSTFTMNFYQFNLFCHKITRLEVLGFHKITASQQEYFNSVFSIINLLPVSKEVIEEAIIIRKNYNLSVGDANISATAFICCSI